MLEAAEVVIIYIVLFCLSHSFTHSVPYFLKTPLEASPSVPAYSFGLLALAPCLSSLISYPVSHLSQSRTLSLVSHLAPHLSSLAESYPVSLS